MPKLKLALYWAASCGGCEIAVLEIHDKILELAEAAEIMGSRLPSMVVA